MNGIIGLENTWFASYLENRMQFCRVNGVPSNVNNINCWVPQGCCLGPLLSLIYVNDLPFSLQNSQVTMNADDTTIYSAHKIDDINDNLNRDLNCLKQWLQGNKLSLNVIKGSVSSSMPCTCRLLVCLCLSPFSWAMKMATNKGQLRDDTCKGCWMKQTL